ncbi:MAG TPA: hypothetical protein VFR97_07000 [Capillimicrobium sp.]|nr:hypothetical protein [Capillimicrobium sp.]
MRHLRNFGIVLLITAAVYALPGGGTAAELVETALFIVVTVGIGLLLARLYVENRTAIYSLGDRWRFVLYAAAGVLMLLLAGTTKMFETGGGTLLWLVLLAAVLYAFYAVARHAREY